MTPVHPLYAAQVNPKSLSVFTALTVIFISISSIHAAIRLPAVIGEHGMFQADKPVAIWGWADPGAKVNVAFINEDGTSVGKFMSTADAKGKWFGKLPALRRGQTGKLEITTDKGEKKIISDILVGEVWLGGGQSNMDYDIGGKKGGFPEETVEIAKNVDIAQREADGARPPIRYFQVVHDSPAQPADDVKGNWVLGNSTNVADFSAVAWNFAVALQNRLHAPIGLIVSCVGGTPAEAWMSKETIEATSVGAAVFARHTKNLAGLTPEKISQHIAALNAWKSANPTAELQRKNRSSKPNLYLPTDIHAPTLLYNGMIRGLQPFTLRGIIWFQSDGNAIAPFEYAELFQALIKSWRAQWGDELPFYFVELNNMYEAQSKPVEVSSHPILREQQHTGLLLPKVGMASSIDLGSKNAHFPKKKPVGERLAGLALRDCYGLTMGQVNSPMFKNFSIEGNKVRLRFTDADGLRVRNGSNLKGFAIRGSSGDWNWANGKIDGQEIVVWCDQVPSPIAVRYAWAKNPVISVVNGAGLPLCPFRTDTDSKE